MLGLPDTTNKQTVVVNANTAGGGACVITLNAVTDNYHVIDYIGGGYHGTPDANSTLIVNDVTVGSELLRIPITVSGPIYIPLPRAGLPSGKSSKITVTLSDGSQIKDLCILYR